MGGTEVRPSLLFSLTLPWVWARAQPAMPAPTMTTSQTLKERREREGEEIEMSCGLVGAPWSLLSLCRAREPGERPWRCVPFPSLRVQARSLVRWPVKAQSPTLTGDQRPA